MAKRKSKGSWRQHSVSKKKKGRKSKAKGHIPLPILEKRLGKLSRIVKSRGGHAK